MKSAVSTVRLLTLIGYPSIHLVLLDGLRSRGEPFDSDA